MQANDYQSFADAMPEAIIVLDARGSIHYINKTGRAFLLQRFHQLEDKNNLADLVNNPKKELLTTFKTWSRSREPLPATVSWKQEKQIDHEQNWRCQGFMLQPATGKSPAILALRCIPGRGQLSEFTMLNRELEKTQIALKQLQQTRGELETQYELAAVTLDSIGDAVITTSRKGIIESLNPIAERLTGWDEASAIGMHVNEVFNIVNEISREPVPNPVKEAIDGNRILELSNHTILISREGREYVIEDSCAPIRRHDGSVVGAVLVFHDVTNDRLARRQLEYLAQHDMLTSLHNRHYFEQEVTGAVELARRGKVKSAILYIDLDEFKTVNDTAGHSVGDSLLTRVAELFSSRLRRGDVLARLGGDEFGVLLQNVKKSEIEPIAASYQKALKNFKFNWEETSFQIHASIGIAYIDKNIGTTAEAFRQADVACYVAKQTGKNRYHIFNKRQDTQARQIGELGLLDRLNTALERNHFNLLFQPIFHCNGIDENYYEVLIRLNDDDQVLTPNMFIPIAERYALMPKIDLWVVKHVFQMINSGQYPDHMFSINLSGTSLDEKEIYDYLTKTLKKNPELAQSFMFELTETAAVSHIEKAAEFIRHFKKHSVRFALDDFGTGFSSFAYLKQLPIDIVKIDGLFVRDITVDPSDLAMVRSINQISHSLGKRTVAEYVESAAIKKLLQNIGVDYLQGYHIGKPAELTRPTGKKRKKRSA